MTTQPKTLAAPLNYATNHVVSHVPSFGLRKAWYRSVGLDVGRGSDIHMGCYLWFYGPGHTARTGRASAPTPGSTATAVLTWSAADHRGQRKHLPGCCTDHHAARLAFVRVRTAEPARGDQRSCLDRSSATVRREGRSAGGHCRGLRCVRMSRRSVAAGVPARVIASRPAQALDSSSMPLPIVRVR